MPPTSRPHGNFRYDAPLTTSEVFRDLGSLSAVNAAIRRPPRSPKTSEVEGERPRRSKSGLPLIGDRQSEEKAASASFLAGHPDLSSVALHQVACDRQAQPGSAAASRSIRFVEALEDARHIPGWNAHARVPHLDQNHRAVAGLPCWRLPAISQDAIVPDNLGAHGDVAARRCELDRVVHQIGDDLLGALDVGQHQGQVAGQIGDQLQL